MKLIYLNINFFFSLKFEYITLITDFKYEFIQYKSIDICYRFFIRMQIIICFVTQTTIYVTLF